MICYLNAGDRVRVDYLSFKLSWLMVWFVSVPNNQQIPIAIAFQTKLTYGMICYT